MIWHREEVFETPKPGSNKEKVCSSDDYDIDWHVISLIKSLSVISFFIAFLEIL